MTLRFCRVVAHQPTAISKALHGVQRQIKLTPCAQYIGLASLLAAAAAGRPLAPTVAAHALAGLRAHVLRGGKLTPVGGNHDAAQVARRGGEPAAALALRT